jgi:hypothetical protein
MDSKNIPNLQNTSHASDEALRRLLDQQTAEVPHDMFERVQAARAAQRSRPIVVWWRTIWALLLLLMLILGVWWVQQRQSKESVQPMSKVEQKIVYQENTALQTAATNEMLTKVVKIPVEIPSSASSASYRIGNISIATQTNKAANEEALTPSNFTENTTGEQPQKPIFVPKTDLINVDKVNIAALATLPLRKPQVFGNTASVLNLTDPCPTFRKSFWGKSKWYVDVYAAPEYAARSFASKSEKSQLYSLRDSGERSWYAFSAGVRASFQMGTGWIFRAGLNYGQQNEIATFDSLGATRTRTITVTENIGGVITTTTKTEVATGLNRTTAYNRYRTLDIPLQIGYGRPLNGAWSWAVYGGVALNLQSSMRARVLGITDTVRLIDVSPALTGGNSPVFNSNIGVSVLLDAALYRQIARRWQVSIEPQIRYELGSWTRTEYPFAQRYTRLGVLVGLRYRL